MSKKKVKSNVKSCICGYYGFYPDGKGKPGNNNICKRCVPVNDMQTTNLNLPMNGFLLKVSVPVLGMTISQQDVLFNIRSTEKEWQTCNY